jgi:hypothetical protein
MKINVSKLLSKEEAMHGGVGEKVARVVRFPTGTATIIRMWFCFM